jgi:hypothetical protein
MVSRGRGKRQREVAIYLAKVLSGQKNKEVGLHFKIKAPAVSGVTKAVEERLETEKTFQ